MAYTPGLKIREQAIVKKTRRLPIPGTVLVKEGDVINPDDNIAKTELPGKPAIVDVASILGIDEELLNRCMVKKVGDEVENGEIIARYRAFWGLVNKTSKSSIKGKIELVSEVSGQVVIREPPVLVSIKGYIPGTIAKILSNEGAIVETPAAFIQGIFGIGGETYGDLMMLSESDEIVDAERIGPECAGKILVVKTSATINALHKAIKVGAKGIVSGGINEKDLVDLMGYEIGVVITGREEMGLTLIVTEGFGENIPMSDKALQLLKKFEGKLACVNGATQIRAGVIRPEVIIPQKGLDSKDLVDYEVEDTESLSGGLMPGTPIRIISEPYFGALGQVVELPSELQLVETESKVRVLKAKIGNGKIVTVPRANVEIIGSFTGVVSAGQSE